MSSTGEAVVRMANQIARNFEVHGEDEAVARTAEHIRLFWDPRMRAALRECDRAALSPVARKAARALEDAEA